MRLNVKREAPEPLPVSEVVLALSEEEAVELAAITGALTATGLGYALFSNLDRNGLGLDHPAYSETAERVRRTYKSSF